MKHTSGYDLVVDEPEGSTLSAGRRPTFSMVGNWISLAPITSKARDLYTIMLMHVNTLRGDSIVWPGRGTLAELIGLEKPKSVDRYLKELINLGAIEKIGSRRPDGGTGPNHYVVHSTPPQNYQGFVDLGEWYEARKEGGITPQRDVIAGQTPAPKAIPAPRYPSGDGGGPQMDTPPEVSDRGPELYEEQLDEENKNPSRDGSLRSPSREGARKRAAVASDGPPATDALFDAPPGARNGNDHDPVTGKPGGGKAVPAKAGRRASPKVVFPDGWEPSTESIEWARVECPSLSMEDLKRETKRVILYSQSERKPYGDHNKMWRNWMLGEEGRRARQARRFAANGGGRGGQRLYRDADHWPQAGAAGAAPDGAAPDAVVPPPRPASRSGAPGLTPEMLAEMNAAADREGEILWEETMREARRGGAW